MTGSGWIRLAAAGLLAAALAGCAAPPPQVVRGDATPAGITLRWSNDLDRMAEAQQIATAHCQEWAGRARLAAETMDRDVTLAQFACR